LKEGSKVKAYVFFKGRAIVFKDRGEIFCCVLHRSWKSLEAVEQLAKTGWKEDDHDDQPKKK
jgi:translation initiation factor IF-3